MNPEMHSNRSNQSSSVAPVAIPSKDEAPKLDVPLTPLKRIENLASLVVPMTPLPVNDESLSLKEFTKAGLYITAARITGMLTITSGALIVAGAMMAADEIVALNASGARIGIAILTAGIVATWGLLKTAAHLAKRIAPFKNGAAKAQSDPQYYH